MNKLYFAYGSNLNHAAMAIRCPAARPVKPLIVPHARLVFRSVADCVYDPDPDVETAGGLWEITDECEAALDRYEGVSSGLYDRVFLELEIDGEPASCLIYTMNEGGVMPPSPSYLDTIRRGYRDFGLDESTLDAAVADAWERQNRTRYLQERHKRKGEETVVPPKLRARVCLTRNRARFGRLVHVNSDGEMGTICWEDDRTLSVAPLHKMRLAALQNASRKAISHKAPAKGRKVRKT